MGKDYRKQLPSGHSQQQGGDSGVRQESPRQQEKPDVILPVINNRAVSKAHVLLYDRKEYERRVKAVLEGNILESTIRETADMLGRQIDLLNGIPLDVLRNNSNKLVNQDMDVTPLEDINRSAENALHQVAGNIHDSSLMKRYVEELTRKEREKWQLSEVDKAMMKGGDKACEVIENKAEGHLNFCSLMKRVIYFGVFGCILALIGTSCANGNKSAAEAVAGDSVLVEDEVEETVSEAVQTNLFDKWFDEFQEANPHWTRTTEGHKKLINAFKKEMTSNLEFAKSVCMDKVFTSDCISSYDRKDGEHGGIWSFVFRKNVTLKNPLYNGQTEVELAYEIFSTIPATEPHERPYLENVNYSDSFNPYHDINYSGTLNLGSYIVTKKDK